MNLNIALNTIIYIMVFLFPGVLFRRFYYLGNDKNQFNHGHLLERFLITILLSVFVLASFFMVNNYMSKSYEISLVFNYSYQDFICLFSNLTSSIIPPIFNSFSKFESFIKTFGLLYLYSAFIGWVSYNTVKFLHLDNWISALRFSNEWQYLLTLPKRKVIKRRPFQKLNAQVDLLTHGKDGEVLYQGFYHKLVLNKDHEIDSIVLTNPKKFIEIDKTQENQRKIQDIEESIKRKEYTYYRYRDYKNKIIYKKHINSHSFVVSKKDIININLLYIKDINTTKKKGSSFTLLGWMNILKILRFLALATALVFLFVDFESQYFNTFWKKILFLFITLIELWLLNNIVNSILKTVYLKDANKNNQILIAFCFMVAFGSFYLNVFISLHLIWCIVIWISVLVGTSIIFNQKK